MKRAVFALATVGALVLTAIGASPSSAASTYTFTVNGTVGCTSGVVQGVWVKSSAGGSGFATLTAGGGTIHTANYSRKLTVTGGTFISLHVGCGPQINANGSWNSDNWTPLVGKYTAGQRINATQCGGGACLFTRAAKAYNWSAAHLTSPGNMHALSSDLVTDARAYNDWYGLCLTFAASAYYNAGAKPVPGPYGSTVTAASWYKTYYDAGLVQKTWTTGKGTTTANPPKGALVFYTDGGAGHIAISAGGGKVISARPANPRVQKTAYSDTRLGTYKGWAYPKNLG